MGSYYTDKTGKQKYRDKRVYTKKQVIKVNDFINYLFTLNKSNFYRFEDLKLYLYHTKAEWTEYDILTFANKANYKGGWVFYKVKEIEEFLKNPSQGIFVEPPKPELDEKEYEEIKPFTKLSTGKYRDKFYKDIEEKDPEYANWYKENVWVTERKLKPQITTKDRSKSLGLPEFKGVPVPDDLSPLDKFLVNILQKIQPSKMLKINHPKLPEYFQEHGYTYDEECWNSLLNQGVVVKVGMNTIDLSTNYYQKLPKERYQSYYDTLEFLQKLNESFLKKVEAARNDKI